MISPYQSTNLLVKTKGSKIGQEPISHQSKDGVQRAFHGLNTNDDQKEKEKPKKSNEKKSSQQSISMDNSTKIGES